MEQYILALDQGTTSCRALVFNKSGAIVSSAQKEFTQHFPKSGWVEHDAKEIWETQAEMMKEALKKENISADSIAGIGITNQRETVVIWDKNTGEPIYNAIVWQDKRTAAYCDELKTKGLSPLIRERTGLVIDAYFSGTKVKWILDEVKGAREKAEAGDLLMGTIDSWLIWNLTDGDLHITDVTNASRTMFFNIHKLEWDRELLTMFNVPDSILPEVKASSEIYGNTTGRILGKEIPIAGIAGDQQAALFGQMCTQPGMVKNTYGTGCFMLMNIGEKPIISQNNLLTSIGWQINGKTHYILEGSIFIAGAVVQWLRDSLKIIDSSGEVEKLACSVDHSDGVYFVPAFAGLGAPHWNQHAKGTIFGLTRGSTYAHIARAAIESIAYQTMDVLKAMQADAGISIKELRVDGGATVNNLLMQFQADVLNTVAVRPKVIETTVMGAAFLAGLAVGFWSDIKEIETIWESDRRFDPVQDRSTVEAGIKGWYKAIDALEYWTREN
ncbi:glycerol kinase GlpK [Muriicola soli]|uniref:Glycerol kinase n=1 Tax=Muriicola soli TaxID=2507538 RepID=A0A411EBZ0_9FLAO|nr:glycerol kinase GlpK [Muriicola soli]QBA65054.1 glycerol kinase [Muriicola soli]